MTKSTVPTIVAPDLHTDADTAQAVEYRLLQHAPFPAAVQDAATVYAHVLQKYGCLSPQSQQSSTDSGSTQVTTDTSRSTNGLLRPNGTWNRQKSASNRVELLGNPTVSRCCVKKPCKIVLIGDSAGGNLVLALARWIRDEAVLPPPDGLLLLSPSCDPCMFHCSLTYILALTDCKSTCVSRRAFIVHSTPA